MAVGSLARGFFLGGRSFHLASTVFHSCAAGSHTLTELRKGIRENWQSWGQGREDLDAGLADWEMVIADRWIRPGASVLLVGSGSGRDLFPLLERGYRVTCVDPADEALAIARQELAARDLSATLISGFIEDVTLDGTFDFVWFSNTSYSLIPESARRVRALARLRSQLNPEGRISLSYQAGLLRPRELVIRAARFAGVLSSSDWRLESGDLVGWKERGGRPFYGYAHAFVPEEIEQEATRAGLGVIDRLDAAEYTAFVLKPAWR